MTRRIALAILLSACAMLIVGGVAAYVAVWETLVAELDQTVVERATALLRTTQNSQQTTEPAVPEGDRYMIRSGRGETLVRPSPDPAPLKMPTVLSRAFADAAGGARVRTLTLRWDDPRTMEPVTIIYSSAAARFDRTMKRLAMTLVVVLMIGIAVTAGVAGWVSRIATRPLQQTAQTIGHIDDRNLDRRIDTSNLPSELIPVATRLNEMLERLERGLKDRQQFMIDAAHELRSPVAALRTTLEVALQPPRDPQSFVPVLEKCLSSTRMLNRLVNLLAQELRSASPEAHKQQPADVSLLLHECADLLETLAQQKQIRLMRSFAPELWVSCETDRLRSIATNLLSNAVAYTSKGGQVELGAARDEEQLRLSVRDTGMGIAPQHLPHIFEPFYRADGARGSDGDHLGLGLYLVQSHVRAMGGLCEVQSTLGEGTTVTVTLPVKDAGAASSTESGPRDEQVSVTPAPQTAISCSSHD